MPNPASPSPDPEYNSDPGKTGKKKNNKKTIDVWRSQPFSEENTIFL